MLVILVIITVICDFMYSYLIAYIIRAITLDLVKLPQGRSPITPLSLVRYIICSTHLSLTSGHRENRFQLSSHLS